MPKALIVAGGWKGHDPENTSRIMAEELARRGITAQVVTTLDALLDPKVLEGLDLIVPHWTMGKITRDQEKAILTAVAGGVGLGGIHGGMCDAFRENTEYQWMTGGQWVAHPGNDGVEYRVRIVRQPPHPITQDLPDFTVKSEKYYMHVDPANRVLATTDFDEVLMPVAWTKRWGQGRVFYCSIGHSAAVLAQPEVLALVGRGLAWAAESRKAVPAAA